VKKRLSFLKCNVLWGENGEYYEVLFLKHREKQRNDNENDVFATDNEKYLTSLQGFKIGSPTNK